MNSKEENGSDGPVVEGNSCSILDENSKHKKKQRRRSIGFKRMVRVRTTLSKIDMTEEEKFNYWLRDDDYDQMRDRYNCDDHKNNNSKWISFGGSSKTKSSLPRICILGWLLVILLFTLGTTVFFLGTNETMDNSTTLEQQHLRGGYMEERRLQQSVHDVIGSFNHPLGESLATTSLWVQTGIAELFDAAKGLILDQ